MRKIFFVSGIAALLLATACKKELANDNGQGTTVTPAIGTQSDLLNDSIYLFSKEIFLWQDLIPSYQAFNPRQYTGLNNVATGTNQMNAIRKLQPLDRFSFVTSIASSEGLQTGQAVSLGFFVKAAAADKVEPIDSVYWYVNYVYDKSTSGLAGVQRGWRINKIDGATVTFNQAGATLLNQAFFGTTPTAIFEFVKPNGATAVANLSKTSFTSNSVLYKNVLNVGAAKVGYVVFNQFFGEPSRTELTSVFNEFKSNSITELVVDLRYNPGGSTATQDALANLIAPATATNQVMYKYVFNSRLQAGNFPLLRKRSGYQNVSFAEANNTQKFSTTGSLSLKRVFFIVSRSSASASELLINNLKPYMEVKLIGDTTFGKPVGFFPVNIYDVAIYPISFKTVNSAGNADFYNGFTPDKKSPDDVTKNWGDLAEPSLASALKFIQTGAFRQIAPINKLDYDQQMRIQKQLEPLNRKLEANQFSGMFLESKN